MPLRSMTRLFLLAGCLLVACGGNPKLGGPCKATCDCTATNAPLTCPGEWVCNTTSTCEYTCKSTCNSSGVSTCGADEDCNGVLCSSRRACR